MSVNYAGQLQTKFSKICAKNANLHLNILGTENILAACKHFWYDNPELDLWR